MTQAVPQAQFLIFVTEHADADKVYVTLTSADQRHEFMKAEFDKTHIEKLLETPGGLEEQVFSVLTTAHPGIAILGRLWPLLPNLMAFDPKVQQEFEAVRADIYALARS